MDDELKNQLTQEFAAEAEPLFYKFYCRLVGRGMNPTEARRLVSVIATITGVNGLRSSGLETEAIRKIVEIAVSMTANDGKDPG